MASHTVLKEELSEMGFEETLIAKALDRLGEKATIESTINKIEELMNSTGDDETTEEHKNGEKTSDEPKPDATDPLLTEQERLKKMAEYEEKIKQRRLEREAKEKEEELKREIKRREDGKGVGKMKEELELIQRKRVADEMKREKAEEKAARDSILAQIARDREEQRQSRLPASAPKPQTAIVPPQPTAVSKEGKCRLAIRLLDGKQLVNEFDNRETLSAVRVYVITQSGADCEISFVMPPLPPFTEDDMQKPLNALGLCPSARVHVIKR